MKEKFGKGFIEIINNLNNTNYDSILGQLKITIYFQELLLKEIITKGELIM